MVAIMNLNIKDADNLLRKLIERDLTTDKNLLNPENFYSHSRGVSNISYLVGCALLYNGINVDVDLSRVSGLLHDSGKVVITQAERRNDPELVFDSIYGFYYLKEMGYSEIAEVIKPSFTTKEMLELRPNIFQDIEASALEPVTWEQKIVVYGDAHINGRGEYVTFDKRLIDIKSRYEKSSVLVRSLEIGGEKRLRELNYEIGEKSGLLL